MEPLQGAHTDLPAHVMVGTMTPQEFVSVNLAAEAERERSFNATHQWYEAEIERAEEDHKRHLSMLCQMRDEMMGHIRERYDQQESVAYDRLCSAGYTMADVRAVRGY